MLRGASDATGVLRVQVHLGPGARAPVRATAGAAGHDLCSCEPAFVIAPGARRLVDTGVRLAMRAPEGGGGGGIGGIGGIGVYARVAPRSGLAVRGVDVAAGVCDVDYRGVYKVLLVNNSPEPFEVRPGDRIAQLVFEACFLDVRTELVQSAADLQYADDDDQALRPQDRRGEGGFGSTGGQ
jgi:dUTP pyrophosphatase